MKNYKKRQKSKNHLNSIINYLEIKTYTTGLMEYSMTTKDYTQKEKNIKMLLNI